MSDQGSDLAVLESGDSTLTQTLRAVSNLEKGEFSKHVTIGISSSATIELLGTYLRAQGLLAGVRVNIQQGNYDDPIGDVDRFLRSDIDILVLAPFFDSLVPSFEAQLCALPVEAVAAKEAQIRERYRLTLEKARSIKSIYLCNFHRLSDSVECSDLVDSIVKRFNQALQEEASAFENVTIIDTQEIVSMIGRLTAFDLRFYFRSKAPYSTVYLRELSRRISLASRGFGTYFYKVLALDCDNTLWGGVIGEDAFADLKLDPNDHPGNVFWRAQQEFSALERNGVLLCLCTKNNAADVDDMLERHPEMVLRDKQLVIKKANWSDKSSNLRAIAQELNLGLESFVFLDDSPFECEGVRQQLPMVKVIQVPSDISEYPRVVQRVKELFLAGGVSAESRSKTEQYRQRVEAEEQRSKFNSQEEYLASLEIRVELTRNARSFIARISELSMKSNQFNLTTQRYAEGEIKRLMEDRNSAVYSLIVSDKFGSAGLTGVTVVRYENDIAILENFFISCRVIGRGVEFSIWPHIVADAKTAGCRELRAKYIPSKKNAQAADFYDRLGLSLSEVTEEGVRQYRVALDEFTAVESQWVEVTYVE